MNFTARFFIYAPFALFVALAAGVSLYWFSQAETLSRHLDGFNGRAVMPGVTMHFSSKRISGFPFRLDAVFRNFELDVAVPGGRIGWRSEAFALHRLTYGADTTVLESSGWQQLSMDGSPGKHTLFAFQPGSMRASAIEADAKLRRFDLVIVGLAGHAFCLAGAEFHFRSRTTVADIEGGLQGNGSCERTRAQQPAESLLMSATLVPERSLASLEHGEIGVQPALEAFRSSRGRVLINRVELSLPSGLVSGTGKMGFDVLDRPEGAIALTVLRSSHSSPSRATSGSGQLATVLENILSPNSWQGGTARLDLDVHDGTISLDGKLLAPLPGLW